MVFTSTDLATPEAVRQLKHVIGHRSPPSARSNDDTGPAGAWHHPPGQCSLERYPVAAVVAGRAAAHTLSAAISRSTMASCSSSSLRASDGFQRPRSSGMQQMKKMIPPKQIQYQVFHWPTVLFAAF